MNTIKKNPLTTHQYFKKVDTRNKTDNSSQKNTDKFISNSAQNINLNFTKNPFSFEKGINKSSTSNVNKIQNISENNNIFPLDFYKFLSYENNNLLQIWMKDALNQKGPRKFIYQEMLTEFSNKNGELTSLTGLKKLINILKYSSYKTKGNSYEINFEENYNFAPLIHELEVAYIKIFDFNNPLQGSLLNNQIQIDSMDDISGIPNPFHQEVIAAKEIQIQRGSILLTCVEGLKNWELASHLILEGFPKQETNEETIAMAKKECGLPLTPIEKNLISNKDFSNPLQDILNAYETGNMASVNKHFSRVARSLLEFNSGFQEGAKELLKFSWDTLYQTLIPAGVKENQGLYKAWELAIDRAIADENVSKYSSGLEYAGAVSTKALGYFALGIGEGVGQSIVDVRENDAFAKGKGVFNIAALLVPAKALKLPFPKGLTIKNLPKIDWSSVGLSPNPALSLSHEMALSIGTVTVKPKVINLTKADALVFMSNNKKSNNKNEFENRQKALNKIFDNLNNKPSKPSPFEIAALYEFMRGNANFRACNSHLRSSKLTLKEVAQKLTTDLHSTIHHMGQLLKKHKNIEGNFQRVAEAPSIAVKTEWRSLRKGDTFSDPAFLSVSKASEKGKNFVKEWMDNPNSKIKNKDDIFLFKIEGKSAKNIQEYSQTMRAADEHMFLPGTKFEVTRISDPLKTKSKSKDYWKQNHYIIYLREIVD